MRRAAAAVASLSLLAACPAATAQILTGGPEVSPEVQAAFAKVRAGDRSEILGLAAAGRLDAQAYAGVLLAFANGRTPADTELGCSYLQAASAERSDAMHFLGEAYQNGVCGGQKDLDRAIAAFHKAGDMGLAKSRCAEGNLLIAMHRDVAHAVELCREGAEKGDADAQTDLGNIYLVGEIVPKDAVAAAGWYERAVAQRHRNAAFTLGQMYWNGDGVARDHAAAARLWRLAYEQGRLDAAALLGNEAFERTLPDYATGQATPGKTRVAWEPLLEAIDWYEKALAVLDPAGRIEVNKRLEVLRDFKAQVEARRPPA